MKRIETTVKTDQYNYIKGLARKKSRSISSLLNYAIKRYCSTDGLKDAETKKLIPYPD